MIQVRSVEYFLPLSTINVSEAESTTEATWVSLNENSARTPSTARELAATMSSS